MSRIQSRFKELGARGQGALIGHIVAGHPDLAKSREYARALLAGDIDLLALGIPFSAPMADGLSLQDANLQALRAGITPDAIFELVKELRGETSIPMVLVTYYNPVLAMGEEVFLKRSLEVGADGVIVSDLPLEEATSFIYQARREHIDTIFVVAPETSEERLTAITAETTGFLCVVSSYGKEIDTRIETSLQRIRALVASELPIVVGFEGSNPTQFHAFIRVGAQGVIVGNVLAERMAAGISPEQLREFARGLRASTQPSSPIAPQASPDETSHLG